jgi:hypothetical protein
VENQEQKKHIDIYTELREFSRNTYIEKRVLDFHANQLFKARQGKSDSILGWIQKLKILGSRFKRAALSDCADEK